eukprot:scaffold80557_cov31-Tisochrysis_lutea.AAC.3
MQKARGKVVKKRRPARIGLCSQPKDHIPCKDCERGTCSQSDSSQPAFPPRSARAPTFVKAAVARAPGDEWTSQCGGRRKVSLGARCAVESEDLLQQKVAGEANPFSETFEIVEHLQRCPERGLVEPCEQKTGIGESNESPVPSRSVRRRDQPASQRACRWTRLAPLNPSLSIASACLRTVAPTERTNCASPSTTSIPSSDPSTRSDSASTTANAA